VQAGSMPSKSRKPHEWPIYPKPDIPGRLPERLLRPTFCPPMLALVAGLNACLAKINERLKLGMPGRALNGDLWDVVTHYVGV
jgi:hypothetical protein